MLRGICRRPREYALDNGTRVIRRVPPGMLLATAAVQRSPIAAASLAMPLAGVSRGAVLAAPLVAAAWAEAVVTAARADGVAVRGEPVVTADLAGITVEALGADRPALRGLPGWFAQAPPMPDPATLSRLRSEYIARLSSAERRSDGVRRALFGPRHRYGIVHQERVRFARAAEGEEIAAATAELLRERPVSPTETNLPAATAQSFGGGRQVVRIAGERCYHLVGTPGVALGSERKFPLHVTWALLGGREGLLDRRLRQARGLTYSLAAFSRELAEGGYGICFAGCRPESLDEVAGEVMEILDGLGHGTVDQALLRSAKERLIIQWHRAMQTERGCAERLTSYASAGLGFADLAAYPAGIAAVTAEDVRAAATTFLAPGTLLEIAMVPGAGSDGNAGS